MSGVEKTYEQFSKLTNAEDFLKFFEIEYDPSFVNVNRLHILKQFSILIAAVDKAFPDISESKKLAKYGEAFQEAYELFKTSSPLKTKLFKVFKDAPKNYVLLDDLDQETED
ncbi:MAG: nitrogenase-stabilizing/protective protein NifW [cyanobacterium endosymbiont of Epithemia adnata isolate EadnSB Bon19]|uniref:nitrogenase-stabilizing/protective protein NifW n=1 Tax=cyanobacterium endosymbiont of Epithemia turgida TaxID=718217 RepID=UPI0004D195B2|nr:nitrogenase-stabilizing/protective protein NifW [cyanobacterium endosymbiont of Epithemia turgida]BAP18203.1 nitrogenase stabilizing/protective protein [cyanobacterium endosymbiont of Epithemia turgida isolate EtSB Lake Yunoko]